MLRKTSLVIAIAAALMLPSATFSKGGGHRSGYRYYGHGVGGTVGLVAGGATVAGQAMAVGNGPPMARFVGFAAENRGDNGVIVGPDPLELRLDLLEKVQSEGPLTSAIGTFRTSHLHRRMSAIEGKADMARTCQDVR
jgi:hypothetical protein